MVSTPLARSEQREGSVAWPLLIEAALVITAIAVLIPWFAVLAARDTGRDSRFDDIAAAAPAGPPASSLCAALSGRVDAVLLDYLCGRAQPPRDRGTSAAAPNRPDDAQSDKNAAMRALLRTAGWQWAAWALVGFLLLQLSRRPNFVARGVALALVAWAAAAWIGRVPWPFGSAHAFAAARAAPWTGMPATFVVGMLGAAIAVLCFAPWLSRALATGPQRATSVFGYPGLVFLTGIGWLLLLDLSANGPPSNRYLALYHHGHLWLGMLTLTLVAFVRQPLGRALTLALSLAGARASRIGRRLGGTGSALLLAATLLALIGVVGVLLMNLRQLTSEIGRLWLIVGGAWFFYLRGTPLAERFARSGSSLGSLLRYVRPLLFVVAVLVGAMVITRDMGPLLIAGYGAGAFVAASVAMWWYQRRGAAVGAYAIAVVLFVGWIAGTTAVLFRVGTLDDVAAARLENLAAPLASANDQLALVTWFQRAAPEAGFGPGAVPWCGFGASGACAGVPAQIQSDYTFTALVGAFGTVAAWTLTIGAALWLHLLIARHGTATSGEPRFVRRGRRMVFDDQAFLSWLCVTWVVLALCQLAVTVAGNLAVIPLTGVTFPFVSFGMTSLVLNMAMLGLAVNVNARDEGAHG
ncbi:MAG: FtsW/RodA/SpoVE family cell cycle protein [Casimicrobiaceae bacterium]